MPLKLLECNSIPLPHLVYVVLLICKLSMLPLTHTCSEIHSFTWLVTTYS